MLIKIDNPTPIADDGQIVAPKIEMLEDETAIMEDDMSMATNQHPS